MDLSKKPLTVSDIDYRCKSYIVTDSTGWVIGERHPQFGYLKGRYSRNGRIVGGKHAGIMERAYRATPPWMKCLVKDLQVSESRVQIVVENWNGR